MKKQIMSCLFFRGMRKNSKHLQIRKISASQRPDSLMTWRAAQVKEWQYKKSDNFCGIAIFWKVTIGLCVIQPHKCKKAPQKVLFIKWCAILCDYRTNYAQECKALEDKIDNLSTFSWFFIIIIFHSFSTLFSCYIAVSFLFTQSC